MRSLVAPRTALGLLSRPLPLSHALHASRRNLRATSLAQAKPLPPRPKINEKDVDEAFLKGSGPGGQKILIHKPTGIVIKAQDTRSRDQNRKIARQRLAEAIELQEKGAASRLAIKAAVASRKKASATKKRRRKYRALDAERSPVQEAAVGGQEAGEDAARAADSKGSVDLGQGKHA